MVNERGILTKYLNPYLNSFLQNRLIFDTRTFQGGDGGSVNIFLLRNPSSLGAPCPGLPQG